MVSVDRYNDDYETCERTSAALCIYHEDLDPVSISEALSLTPSHRHRKGDRIGTRSRGTYKTGAWIFSTKNLVQSKDCQRHIDYILDRLTGKEGMFLELGRRGHQLVMCCPWWSAFGHGGPRLHADSMGRLAALGLELWFDVYFFSPDETDARRANDPTSG